MARMITLYKWAEAVFGEKPPHRHTLWKWIAEGRIRPVPRKIGRAYFCAADAEYVDPVAQRREEILSGRSTPTDLSAPVLTDEECEQIANIINMNRRSLPYI